ncbi:MAG: CobD/Cbib protein, partial [Acidimicrobiales bacterium]|nr:CobD/Cbib protein [Acidimicrobiales bacterium]
MSVAAGILADRVLGEPPTAVHPVAAFGAAMGAVERRLH